MNPEDRLREAAKQIRLAREDACPVDHPVYQRLSEAKGTCEGVADGLEARREDDVMMAADAMGVGFETARELAEHGQEGA